MKLRQLYDHRHREYGDVVTVQCGNKIEKIPFAQWFATEAICLCRLLHTGVNAVNAEGTAGRPSHLDASKPCALTVSGVKVTIAPGGEGGSHISDSSSGKTSILQDGEEIILGRPIVLSKPFGLSLGDQEIAIGLEKKQGFHELCSGDVSRAALRLVRSKTPEGVVLSLYDTGTRRGVSGEGEWKGKKLNFIYYPTVVRDEGRDEETFGQSIMG